MPEATAGGERRERVDLPQRGSDIRIGAGLRDSIWTEIATRFPGARRCGLVVDEHVHALWPLPTGPAELDVRACSVPRGEGAKRRPVLARLQDELIGLRRHEPIVVLGGGATLDVGGFCAATVRRGLPWIAVPTTVIGMADAAVGGKVAINHARGKNLIGTFHPPALVLSDVETLATLEARDVASGLAEIYKVARIGDPDLLTELRARGAPVEPQDWIDVLARAVAVKARIVEVDERDHGERRLLNYGHTIGHALETHLGPDALRHGEAVAIGMRLAADIAVARGLISAREARMHVDDLTRLGLATRLPDGVTAEDLLPTLGLDKKRAAEGTHTMVLPHGACGARVHEDVREAELRAALR